MVSPPGRLTADWIRGRRVGYLAPLSLFLWINVAFFLIQSISGLGILTWPLRVHLSDDSIGWLTNWLLAQRKPGVGAAMGGYADIFNALEAVHAKSLVIVMVPAFAAILGALTLDRPEPFRHVLTFATHFFSFALLWLCLVFPIAAIVLRLIVGGGAAVSHAMDLAVSAVEAGGLAWYLYIALGTVFGMSWLRRSHRRCSDRGAVRDPQGIPPRRLHGDVVFHLRSRIRRKCGRLRNSAPASRHTCSCAGSRSATWMRH